MKNKPRSLASHLQSGQLALLQQRADFVVQLTQAVRELLPPECQDALVAADWQTPELKLSLRNASCASKARFWQAQLQSQLAPLLHCQNLQVKVHTLITP